jgi:hypothetical protein
VARLRNEELARGVRRGLSPGGDHVDQRGFARSPRADDGDEPAIKRNGVVLKPRHSVGPDFVDNGRIPEGLRGRVTDPDSLFRLNHALGDAFKRKIALDPTVAVLVGLADPVDAVGIAAMKARLERKVLFLNDGPLEARLEAQPVITVCRLGGVGGLMIDGDTQYVLQRDRMTKAEKNYHRASKELTYRRRSDTGGDFSLRQQGTG